MRSEVRVSGAMRAHVPGRAGSLDVEVADGATVRDVLEAAALWEHLFDPELGELRGGVVLYLNDEDLRYLDGGVLRLVTATDTVSVMTAVAGG